MTADGIDSGRGRETTLVLQRLQVQTTQIQFCCEGGYDSDWRTEKKEGERGALETDTLTSLGDRCLGSRGTHSQAEPV